MEIRISLEVGQDSDGLPELKLIAFDGDNEILRKSYSGDETIKSIFALTKESLVKIKIIPTMPPLSQILPPQITFTHSEREQISAAIHKNDLVKCVKALEREDGYQLQVGAEYRVIDIVAAGKVYEVSLDSNPSRIQVFAEEIVFSRREKPLKKEVVFETTGACQNCKETIALKKTTEDGAYIGVCPFCNHQNTANLEERP